MLWEIQSLSRFRPVAGDPALQKAFAELACCMTNFGARQALPAAYIPGWKAEIHRMRMRIEKERTPAGKDALAIKTGSGGLMDVEFTAQALCLEHGWHEPNTLQAVARAMSENKIPKRTGAILSDNYRKLIQIERILRRWSFEPETILPDDPAPFYRVAVRCGFKEGTDFAQAVASYRGAIREAYSAYFLGASKAGPKRKAKPSRQK